MLFNSSGIRVERRAVLLLLAASEPIHVMIQWTWLCWSTALHAACLFAPVCICVWWHSLNTHEQAYGWMDARTLANILTHIRSIEWKGWKLRLIRHITLVSATPTIPIQLLLLLLLVVVVDVYDTMHTKRTVATLECVHKSVHACIGMFAYLACAAWECYVYVIIILAIPCDSIRIEQTSVNEGIISVAAPQRTIKQLVNELFVIIGRYCCCCCWWWMSDRIGIDMQKKLLRFERKAFAWVIKRNEIAGERERKHMCIKV